MTAARVVKAAAVPASLLPIRYRHPEQAAEQIIAQARAQAQDIVQRAEADVRSSMQEARRQADALLQETGALNRSHAEEVAVQTRALQQAAHASLREQEPQLLELAIEVASKLVAQQVRSEPGMIKSIVDDALVRVHDRSRAVVRIHPMHAPALASLPLALIEDASLDPADAIVELPHGIVDARWVTKVAALRRAWGLSD